MIGKAISHDKILKKLKSKVTVKFWSRRTAAMLLSSAILLGTMLPFFTLCLAQSPAVHSATRGLVKHISFFGAPDTEVPAYRLGGSIQVDGILSEKVWQLPGVTGFTQQDPHEGEPATEETVVWVAYDDDAIYCAIRMYDSAPDSIVAGLGRRDQDLKTDWMAVGIDAYRDKQTGFYFLVTAGGSIGDGTIFNDSNFDDTWDGVWDSAVNIDSLGWTVEMRIPFSQLRFTKKKEYVWGFNVLRFIQRKQESSYLVEPPKEGSRDVSLYPPLVGIKDIQPPRRMEVIPYVMTRGKFLQFGSDDPFNRKQAYDARVGADVKLGLGSNFTLDGTINPDFGQVELDPAVVNLSDFETFFDEKRLFFIEGANIFSFGRRGTTNNWGFSSATPSFFYSRRIGRPPQGETTHAGEEEIPANSTILAAVKLSGKTKHNWEIGVLQAVTAREYALTDSLGVRFKDEVEPLTSYTVLRTFKNFKDNRYGLGLLGTSVVRDLRTENLRNTLGKNAFAGAIDGYAFLGKEKGWALSGWMGLSRVSGREDVLTELQEAPQHYYQRPDFEAESVDSTRTSLGGWAGRVALNKEKGNYYLNAAIGVNSPGFETNDLGFHWRSNVINQHLVVGHRWYQPGKIFRNASLFLANFRNFDFDGNRTAEGVMTFFNGRFLNYYGISASGGFFPSTLDITRTRGGPMMKSPTGFFVGLSGSSDDRKSVEVALSGNYGANQPGGWEYSIATELEWKPSNRMELRFSPRYFRDHAIAQWVTKEDAATAQHTFGARYIFGILNQKQIAVSFRMNYAFTSRLSFQIFLQPLLAAGHYSDFKELARPRSFDFIHYGEGGTSITAVDNEYEIDPDGSGQNLFSIDNPDFNFKSLRGTAVLRWEFAPGSTLFFVWTHDRSEVEDRGDLRFGRDIRRLLDVDSDNIVLLKLSYWWNP